jgi:hypothetical protein
MKRVILILLLLLSIISLSGCRRIDKIKDELKKELYDRDLLNDTGNKIEFEESEESEAPDDNNQLRFNLMGKNYTIFNEPYAPHKNSYISDESGKIFTFYTRYINKSSILTNGQHIYIFDGARVYILDKDLNEIDTITVFDDQSTFNYTIKHHAIFVLNDGVYVISQYRLEAYNYGMRIQKIFNLNFENDFSNVITEEFEYGPTFFNWEFSHKGVLSFKSNVYIIGQKSYFLIDNVIYNFDGENLDIYDRSVFDIIKFDENEKTYIKMDIDGLKLESNRNSMMVLSEDENISEKLLYRIDNDSTTIVIETYALHRMYLKSTYYYQTYIIYIDKNSDISYVKLNGMRVMDIKYANGELSFLAQHYEPDKGGDLEPFIRLSIKI